MSKLKSGLHQPTNKFNITYIGQCLTEVYWTPSVWLAREGYPRRVSLYFARGSLIRKFPTREPRGSHSTPGYCSSFVWQSFSRKKEARSKLQHKNRLSCRAFRISLKNVMIFAMLEIRHARWNRQS